MSEISDVARPGTAPKVAEAVSKALELFAQEDYDQAVRFASEAKVNAPRSSRICELLGLALYHAGNWKEALRELLTYRRLTNSVDQNHVIADLYRAQGRPDRALEVAAEVRPGDVSPVVWAETVIVAAGALADKEDLRGALAMMNRAELDPGEVEPYHLRLWYALADLLERAGRRREAEEAWSRIVAEEPDFFDVQERLATHRR